MTQLALYEPERSADGSTELLTNLVSDIEGLMRAAQQLQATVHQRMVALGPPAPTNEAAYFLSLLDLPQPLGRCGAGPGRSGGGGRRLYRRARSLP